MGVKDPCHVGQRLKAIREQLARLEDDFKSKMIEEAMLQTEVDKLNHAIEDAEGDSIEAARLSEELKQKIAALLRDRGGMDPREFKIELERQIYIMQQNIYDTRDECEDLRSKTKDLEIQIGNYQTQYSSSLQYTDEQKGELNAIQIENNRLSEKMEEDVQRLRDSFNEKMDELTPLVDKLSFLQQDLANEKQMNERLTREIDELCKDMCMKKLELRELEEKTANKDEGSDEDLLKKLEEITNRYTCLEEQYRETRKIYDSLGLEVEEKSKTLEEKMHENIQLATQIETVRNESVRSIGKTKEKSEKNRRELQNQIFEMEKQLAQCKLQSKVTNEERDMIRRKMQCQIYQMNDNFEQAQMRIRVLQGHVNVLSSTMDPLCCPPPPDCDCLEA